MADRLKKKNDGLTDDERQVVANWLLVKYSGFTHALETARKAGKRDPTGWSAGSIQYYRTAVRVMRFLLHHVGWELPQPGGDKADGTVDVP